MRIKFALILVVLALILVGANSVIAHSAIVPAAASQAAMGTAFTYQGQIESGGSPITGTCDMQFALYDAASSGSQIGVTQTSNSVSVTNGLFTVSLDFGSSAFNGDARWLDIQARCPAGSGSYTLLTPRQALAPAPYALFSSGAPWGGVSGVPSPIAFLANPSSCSNGQMATWNGTTWTCAAATTYSAGAGLALTGPQFSVITSTIQQRVSGTCSSGNAISNVNADGTVTCEPIPPQPYKTPQQIAMLKWYTAISTTQSNFGTGSQPVGIAFDGANMWVANFNNGTVSVLRASDGSNIATYGGFSNPNHLAYDGVNMWITNYAANTVSVLRASDGFRVMTPTVGSGPGGIAFDGVNMWVVNSNSSTVSVLRASDGYHVMTPTVSSVGPDIAFDGTNMWITNYVGYSVSVIRAIDGSRVMTLTTSSPQGIAFDGANMWVGNFYNATGNTVSVFRASDGALVKVVTVGQGPRGIAFDGTNIWVANNGSTTVSVVRASDGVVIATVPVGHTPWGIAFDGAFMWITNPWDDTVSKR